MKYLTKDDLTLLSKTNILSDITNDSDLIYDNTEQGVLDMIDSYIGTRYDTNYEYSLTGFNRNNFLIRIATDIFLYDIMTRLSTDIMSDLREIRYNDAIKKLQDINKGILNINIKQKDIDNDNTGVYTNLFSTEQLNNTQF